MESIFEELTVSTLSFAYLLNLYKYQWLVARVTQCEIDTTPPNPKFWKNYLYVVSGSSKSLKQSQDNPLRNCCLIGKALVPDRLSYIRYVIL